MSRWIYLLICGSALVIPLVVSRDGRDSFRLPKELAFRGEMVLLAALLLIGLLVRELNWKNLRWKHPVMLIASVAVGWTTISAATSTNLTLSVPALLHVCGAAMVFIATTVAASSARIGMLRWAAWSGIVNSILYLAVVSGLADNPLGLDAGYIGQFEATGLLGNANDVGNAIFPVAVAAVAAAIADRAHRVLFIVTASLATAAVLVSVSIAASGALLVALGALAFVWNWKRALVVVLLLSAGISLLALVHSPFRARATTMIAAAENARWNDLSSGRLTAFAAAVEMFRDHPLTGVGPGTFGWQYYPYKLEVSERNPDLLMGSPSSYLNFEETHNDHLEVLAETGAPGYAIFLGSLVFVASGSLRRPIADREPDIRSRFARLAQLPLALGLGVLALAQYPLQLASSLTTTLFIVAACSAWRNDILPITRPNEDVDA